jgi:hypothetical protein
MMHQLVMPKMEKKKMNKLNLFKGFLLKLLR